MSEAEKWEQIFWYADEYYRHIRKLCGFGRCYWCERDRKKAA